MAKPTRTCLFEADSTGIPSGDAELPVTKDLRKHFDQLPNVVIVGEASSWAQLKDLLKANAVDMVAVNLDDGDQQRLDIVSAITSYSRNIDILGISRKKDPQSILSPIRAGCKELIMAPIELADLRDALERIRAARLVAPTNSKRILVVGSSGGVGTTTVVCNLAIALAQASGSRSAIVDLNLEYGDTCCAFDCDPMYTIADVCRDDVDIDDDLLSKALHVLPCNVSLLATPRNITDAQAISPAGVERMLTVLRDLFPFVVVDLPRSYSFLTAATLEGTDHVLIITQLNVPSIRNAERVYLCLLEMGVDEDRIELVVNRSHSNFQQISPKDVEAHLKRPLFALIPNDYRRLRLSLDLGHPMHKSSSAGPARTAIATMANKLIEGDIIEQQAALPSTGLLAKLWG